VCIRLAHFIGKAERTLEAVDKQLAEAEEPLNKSLSHFSGVAESVDDLVAKVNRIADSAEKAAGAVAKTADAAQAAVTPAVANLVGVVIGVSQGAKQFFRSRGRNGSQDS
jgi:methyl-accepting chemotaxis protein